MAIVLLAISLLSFVVWIVCHIMILIHAFKESVAQGFLCLCVPCYIVYYMFTKFEHEKKGLIIGGWWAANVASGIVQVAGTMAGA